MSNFIIEEEPGLYKILELKALRRTPKVYFDVIPKENMPQIDSVDRVIHETGAISPGRIGEVERPWYMHPAQDDNLIVLQGKRFVDIYTHKHGKIESFEVTPHYVKRNGEIVFEGEAVLVWPRGVFHRIKTCDIEGSASINLATHYHGFDIRTNFNIYELHEESGKFEVIREGHLDQI